VRYSDVEEEEVIFLPDVLPISLVDNTELNYTAATVDSDGSFTEELSNLNFSSYSEMGLSEDTTVDVGDYLAFYTGTLSDASSADSVVYARVTGVTDNNGSVTVTFSATTVEEMQEVLDYYSENDVDGDELLDGIDIAVVEKEVEQQVLESGFAEDASAYLTALAVETDGFKKMVGDDFELESLSAKMDDGSSVNLNEISLMAVPSKLSIRNLKVKASIGTKLNKISGKGVRCAVAASFDVPVQTKDGDYIVISLSATFVEEVKISVNASGHPVWKKSIIPHITDYSMNANIDVYNFTGISFQAIVTSKQGGSFDISKEIQKLLSNSNSEQISAGVQNLFEIYSDMMDNDVDWIEIFKQNIVTSNVSVLFGIIQIRTTVDFVVSGEINMALGCNFEYKSGTRYCFWAKLRARKAGSNTIDLIDEVYSFQFYVMGSLGLRAGIKLEFAVGLLSVNLDSVGLTAEAGVYTRLYGYFYYNLESINKLKTSSKSGALLLDFGIYLEIAFKAQVLNGKYQYNPMLYKHEWPLLSVGSRYNVYDFAYDDPKNTIKMKDTVRYILPDDRFNMTCLDLRKGGISTKRYDANHFWTTFSNRNFRLLDGNIVMVNVPKGTRKMECDMTVTWRSTSLAFSSLPITRSFHLVWDNINDNGYTISYNSMGGSVVSSVTQRYETTVTAPIAPRKAGYTFSGWYSDEKLTTRYIFSTMPGENIVLYAKWTAKTDTSYQVEHYQQNVANDNYTLYETETLSGITDTPAKVTAKAYTGFTYSDTKETISAGIIEGEGSLVLKLYYDRNGYILNFKPQNGGDDIVTTMKYGADISAPALVKSGYSFYGWDTAVDATMPAANATYTAQWVINSYTIDFITNGGNDVDSITQAYGTTLFEPAKPTKEGYLFAGWYRDRSLTKHYSISTMPAENITLYAKWYSIPNTAYKVEYYQQNVLDEEYTLKGTENLLGTLGTTVTATAKIYEGFTFNNSASNTVSSGLLTADGNLTLKLYYDRNTYTITFDSNEGSNVEAMNQKYGTTVSAPENPTKSGYIFGGWLRNKALTEAYTFSTMPAENITLYAKWNLSTGTAYKVEHYQQNILDEEYTLKETENLTGKLGTTVTATAKTYEGFTFNSNASKTVSSGILTADGNLTLKLYYDRITYTEYKVEHYQQNVGSSGFSLVETETFTGITGSTVTAEAKKYEGFNFFEFEQDTVSSGILVAGENLTLKLYYRRNYCTINYVSVGQTELFSRVTMYNSIADRPQDPTRLNFIFEGWYIDSSFTTPYNFDTLVTEDITLIAKWKMDGTDAKYMLWIGGVQVTTDNMNSVTGSAITGTISYEPESSTLTLNNATITGYYGENDIYAIYDGQSDSSLTINVIGTNVINMPSDTSRMRQSGIYEYNSLTIGGDSTASLVITAGAADELSAGLAVKDTATIKGGVAVTATGGEIVATDSAIFSTGFWATGSTSTIIITDDSVLRMYGGNAETSIGYRNNYGYQSGVLSVSNGGKIIAAGNTKAMDGMIFVPAQVYTGQSLDGNDKTIFSGDMSGNWCDDIKYVEATN
ncbi:MAG: InlB B-repeat-containing protein, partial [Velocimicrobium sp.]